MVQTTLLVTYYDPPIIMVQTTLLVTYYDPPPPIIMLQTTLLVTYYDPPPLHPTLKGRYYDKKFNLEMFPIKNFTEIQNKKYLKNI